MMFACLALCMVAAAVTWLVSAFILRCRQTARYAATCLVPPLLVFAMSVTAYMLRSGPVHQSAEAAGWTVVLIFVSLAAASFAILPAMATWLLMEARFGGQTR